MNLHLQRRRAHQQRNRPTTDSLPRTPSFLRPTSTPPDETLKINSSEWISSESRIGDLEAGNKSKEGKRGRDSFGDKRFPWTQVTKLKATQLSGDGASESSRVTPTGHVVTCTFTTLSNHLKHYVRLQYVEQILNKYWTTVFRKPVGGVTQCHRRQRWTYFVFTLNKKRFWVLVSKYIMSGIHQKFVLLKSCCSAHIFGMYFYIRLKNNSVCSCYIITS